MRQPIYAYLVHGRRVITAGTGQTRNAAATAALRAVPTAYRDLAAADCRFRYVRHVRSGDQP